ncbi:MAG TPA: hypothetical protein VK324_10290 [Tepidisphaeraceae bacterium]|nr:hypothetical protein [Tepidisphaeraceae bacterium]
MRNVAIAVILVSLVGFWIHPLFSDAGTASEQPRNRTPVALMSVPKVPKPVEQSYSVVKGQPGFWRLGRDANGVWWFLTPDDRPEFLNAVTTVQPYQRARDVDGPQFVSKDWIVDPATGKGDLNHWASRTIDRVRGMGFKSLGAWCHPIFHQFDIPVTRDLNVWTWIPPHAKRLYSPEWNATAEEAIRKQTVELKDNRQLIGYFTDNELDWGEGSAGPAIYFDHLPPTDLNRAEVVTVIKHLWPDVTSFNAAWGTQFTDYVQLDEWQTLPRERVAAYNQLAPAWLYHLARDYFRLTSELVRKYDPNHLVLGVRFKGYAPPEVCRASRDFTDAQSINYYPDDARLDWEQFHRMYQESGQPIVLSEYAFHALDGRSGNRNTVGFAGQVPDQQARADGYRQMTRNLARVPWVVAADWFQWMDEPPSGRVQDGEDVNFGLVDIDDRPYDALAGTVRETATVLNDLHAASHVDRNDGVWRENFLANKPTFRVPRLTAKLTLNGELSDWPAESLLPGVRHSQTVGLERSKLPLPEVRAAWADEGLYVAFQVFDNDVLGAPAKGWWWTRDNVELWVSTRPVASDRGQYDVNCHQFFFVPIEFPGADGIAGVVGQWHRPGDALKESLIPHPAVQDAVRIRPDRYVVEMLIPASALHGWDPHKQPALAFNLHVRNFQHATDYFWSAPKTVMTQTRPNTWGTLYLDPAPGREAQARLE